MRGESRILYLSDVLACDDADFVVDEINANEPPNAFTEACYDGIARGGPLVVGIA